MIYIAPLPEVLQLITKQQMCLHNKGVRKANSNLPTKSLHTTQGEALNLHSLYCQADTHPINLSYANAHYVVPTDGQMRLKERINAGHRRQLL